LRTLLAAHISHHAQSALTLTLSCIATLMLVVAMTLAVPRDLAAVSFAGTTTHKSTAHAQNTRANSVAAHGTHRKPIVLPNKLLPHPLPLPHQLLSHLSCHQTHAPSSQEVILLPKLNTQPLSHLALLSGEETPLVTVSAWLSLASSGTTFHLPLIVRQPKCSTTPTQNMLFPLHALAAPTVAHSTVVATLLLAFALATATGLALTAQSPRSTLAGQSAPLPHLPQLSPFNPSSCSTNHLQLPPC
jgi:hypothetical protein